MIISIDYDDTITRAPLAWKAVVDTLKMSGAIVYMVTMRHKHEHVPEMDMFGIDIVFTGRKGKRKYMYGLGIKVDIWIDDTPEFIIMDAAPDPAVTSTTGNGKVILTLDDIMNNGN